MSNKPEKMYLPTIDSTQVEVFCNWNDKVNGDFIKFLIDGEKEFICPVGAFSKIAILLAREEEKEQMIQTRSIPIRVLQKIVTIRLKKNMHAGELLSIPVTMEIPLGTFNNNSNLTLLT